MQSLKRALFGVAMVATMCVATTTRAQEQKPDSVELSPTQIDTNNRAVRMLGESPPRTKEAIKLVEAALLMESKGDLLYLTLGRAYQLDGQCFMAAEQFYAAERAPGVKGVPEDFVAGQLAQYREDLESCMGRLVIDCDPGDVELELADSQMACGESIELEPGAYIVKGVNTSSNIEVEIPVQILSGQTTRSQIKIPGRSPGDKDRVDTSKPTEQAPEPEEPVDMTWWVAPFAGIGTTTNVIERTSAAMMVMQNRQARFPHYADQSLQMMLGVRGRALWQNGSFRYGAGSELRYERVLIDSLDGDDIAVFINNGMKFALYPQLWFSKYLGVFLGGAMRPRRIFVDDLNTDMEEPNTPGYDVIVVGNWNSLGLGLGGGVKAELGSLFSMNSLEISLGWLQPTSGFAGRQYRPEDFPYSNEEPRNAVPALEALVRAQLGKVMITVGWEGWYSDTTKSSGEGGGRTDNLRATQLMFGMGWTFGSAPK